MASPYTSQPVTGYNANAPADDGSAVSTNRVLWSTIKSKLGDPLNVFAAAINSAVSTAIGKTLDGASPTAAVVNMAVTSTHQGKLIFATATGITITFPDATSVGSPFVFGILNANASGTITIAGPVVNAVQQTINGSASLLLTANEGYIAFTDGSNWYVVGRKTGNLPRGYVDGCTLGNGADATNDITITAGVCRDSTNTVDITVAAMATGKQLDANWAPGDAAGMRNSGAGITNTTYHLYAVAKADGTQDIYAHTSATVATVLTALQAETGGASYIYARRIGSIIRASNTIRAFVQDGDTFTLLDPPQDISVTDPGTASRTSRTLSVPAGIRVRAQIFVAYGNANSGTASFLLVTDLTAIDSTPSSSLASFPIALNGAAGSSLVAGMIEVMTNTSSQVGTKSDFSNSSVTLKMSSRGWVDRRGRDS